jgi:hypothetical protein
MGRLANTSRILLIMLRKHKWPSPSPTRRLLNLHNNVSASSRNLGDKADVGTNLQEGVFAQTLRARAQRSWGHPKQPCLANWYNQLCSDWMTPKVIVCPASGEGEHRKNPPVNVITQVSQKARRAQGTPRKSHFEGIVRHCIGAPTYRPCKHNGKRIVFKMNLCSTLHNKSLGGCTVARLLVQS